MVGALVAAELSAVMEDDSPAMMGRERGMQAFFFCGKSDMTKL